MYINTIDELIDKLIDNFYFTVISSDKNTKNGKLLDRVFNEMNYVKYQKELNELMENYIKSIDLTEIREIVKTADATFTVTETLKRYVAIYLFLTIGFNYKSRIDTYINNIVEFTKNQGEYSYKINNFFNSESNSLIVKYFNFVKNIILLLDADKKQIENLRKKPDIIDVIKFLNELGTKFIDEHFKSKNNQDNGHNIIKTIIILLIYKTHEKIDFFKILEMTETSGDEYMFIDIVEPTQSYIDFNTIERILETDKRKHKHIAHDFWEFIFEREKKTTDLMNIEDKIIKLIESGILYPICDDFLLYHKNSEKYDKTIEPNQIKKKSDTRIRYIVNKINMSADLYTDKVKSEQKLQNLIKKNFYVPLINRKAVLVNRIEDTNIINKFQNQSTISIENEEYINDLYAYNVYPYINFTNFEHSGFTISVHKTIDAIRYVSLNKMGDFKQNLKRTLQFRTSSKDMLLNVVGFILPANNKALKCLKSMDVVDIRELSDENNGYELMLNYLKEINIINSNKSVYWIFDSNKDNVKVDVYEQYDKLSISEQIKHVISVLYDNLLYHTYSMFIDDLTKREKITLQTAYKLFDKYCNNLLNIKDNKELLNETEARIYSTVEKINPKYDISDDIVYGIGEKSIKLPELSKQLKQKTNSVVIDMSGMEKILEIEEKERIDGICQHNISWSNLISIQKSDPKNYADSLYLFIQQYAIENVDNDFICRSCGFQLNIKKYIIDGTFDDTTQKFITYSTPMIMALEDIPEYEKYKIAIRNIEKLIEKIALVSNIPNLTKSTFDVKALKTAIVKDTIDIILLNNRKLKNIFKHRNETSSKLYNIDRNLSDLFVFELENSIFVISSKDKDFYKPIKQNNIISYLIFLMILDLSDTHITFIGNDRKGLCNFIVFEKIYKQLFGDLKIRINQKGKLDNIINYKILCYSIYIIGCSITKYNMWYYKYPDPTKKKKYIPIIQKIFINTLVDIINSILEYAQNSNTHRLYEVLSIKFYKKLHTIFNSNEIYKKLRELNKISSYIERRETTNTKNELIDLSGTHVNLIKFDRPYWWRVCKGSTLQCEINNNKENTIHNISNLTNCSNGEFHDWKRKNKRLICSKCNLDARTLKIDNTISNNILNEYKYINLQNIANENCYKDGLIHQYEIDPVRNLFICIKCKKPRNNNFTNKELDELKINIEKNNEQQFKKIINDDKNIKNEIKENKSYEEKIYNKLMKLYNNDNKLLFVDKFIDELQEIVGQEIVGGGNITTHLKYNIYVIDHDHLGLSLDKNIVINENSGKIFYKTFNQFFKTSVIYYVSTKIGKIKIYYDATTKILLGYKEENKDYVLNDKNDKKIIINYSLQNKLKMLGYSYNYINLTSQYEKYLSNMFDKNNKDINFNEKNEYNETVINLIIDDVVRNRLLNLKKVIYLIKISISKIINAYPEQIDENEFFTNKLNIIIDKYIRIINDLKITDENNNHMVFKHWKGITRNLKLTNIDKQNIQNIIINIYDINKQDTHGNLLLFFIIDEFTKLIKYNDNKFNKITISQFIIDFINYVFDLFNNERYDYNIVLKRFVYYSDSYTYVNQVAEDTSFKKLEGIYSEYRDPDNEITEEQIDEMEDAIQEQEAIDEEGEYDYEGAFDRNMNVNYPDRIDFFESIEDELTGISYLN